jgi:hypothetical protein
MNVAIPASSCTPSANDGGDLWEATEAVLAMVRQQILHAEANGHHLGQCQGVAPGEVVPAVRVDYLEAVLERFQTMSSPGAVWSPRRPWVGRSWTGAAEHAGHTITCIAQWQARFTPLADGSAVLYTQGRVRCSCGDEWEVGGWPTDARPAGA